MCQTVSMNIEREELMMKNMRRRITSVIDRMKRKINHFTYSSRWHLIKSTQLEQGLTHREYKSRSLKANRLNVMVVDLSNGEWEIDLLIGKNKTVSETLNKCAPSAVAGMNGSLFHLDTHEGLFPIINGNMIDNINYINTTNRANYVYEPLAIMKTNEGKLKIGRYELYLEFPELALSIPFYSKIHHPRMYRSKKEWLQNKQDSDLIYLVFQQKHEFKQLHTAVSFTYKGSVTLDSQGMHVETLFSNRQCIVAVPANYIGRVNQLKKGDDYSGYVALESEYLNPSLEFLLTSGPLLVKNNQLALTMSKKSKRQKAKAPRSAFGLSADGQTAYFIVLDGRQPLYSNGMSLETFAKTIKQIGISDAINLDGGGSSTLVSKQPHRYYQVLNRPSNKLERPVHNLLAIKKPSKKC